MFSYTVIATDDHKFSFSALLEENGEYVMASFKVEDEGIEICLYDNPRWLVDTFYPFLKGDISIEAAFEDGQEYHFSEQDKEEIIELFLKAEKMGFFKKMTI